MIRVFEVMASVAAETGDDAQAVVLAGAITGLRDRLGVPLSQAERERLETRVAPAIARLELAESEREWGRGTLMGIEEVLRFIGVPTAIDK
jgi:hypothetical protein